MSAPLNVALVGYGYAGRTIHAPLIQASPRLKLHTVVSSKGEQVQADHPGVQVASDTSQALADPQIDLVVIASPNNSHFVHADSALAAGKHVVVDKPFTVTLSEAQQLIVQAKHHQRLLSVFHNRRWDADFLTVQQLLAAGTLGEIALFESRFERYRPQVQVRWRESDVAGGGLWYDLGPHLLDQVLQLFGMPHAIHADLACQRPGAVTTDYFHVQLRYPRLRVLLSGSCLISGGSPRFAVHGSGGSYVKYGLDNQEAMLKRGQQPGDAGWGEDTLHGMRYWQVDGEPHGVLHTTRHGDYRRYYDGVAAAILDGTTNPVPAEQAAQVMRLIELGEDSARRGQELPVNGY
ncbi:oxidoreductase [Vogesella sp. LIG4]|uniref:oxidoreductase n=1 Tax=Vogesella sp. LIG4 TaxID=1192162 RepID=UPI00081FC245|nr:oxidoreductase [Vogesella sp. LIG4]SCK29229.1 Predicted dehydrogenase [Vogesella sp. LIG4]